MSETNEMKPCPFCGGEDLKVYSLHGAGAWVACRGCGLESPTETGVTHAQAIEYWNTRLAAEPAAGVIEALDRFAKRADDLPATARDDTMVHFRLRDCRAARAALSKHRSGE